MGSSPEDRTGVLKSIVEAAGGKVITLDYCFGEFAVVVVLEMLHNTAMTCLTMGFWASGPVAN